MGSSGYLWSLAFWFLSWTFLYRSSLNVILFCFCVVCSYPSCVCVPYLPLGGFGLEAVVDRSRKASWSNNAPLVCNPWFIACTGLHRDGDSFEIDSVLHPLIASSNRAVTLSRGPSCVWSVAAQIAEKTASRIPYKLVRDVLMKKSSTAPKLCLPSHVVGGVSRGLS